MRRILITLTALCSLGLAASAWAGPTAPDTLRLEPPKTMEAVKSPVDFPHGAHLNRAADCTTCHHTWDGKSDIRACGSSGCHDQPGKKGETAFYTAFHGKDTDRSCLGCHKTAKKDGKPAPASCKQCHQ
ncbi:Cytochrome c, class III, conserved region [Pseudodesulfovibrio mercurii]|uniref:Cytochrome c, class III, conserved region n=1 Tax=Pseudodesulfovibrio mercurii TaxID=641491 RepID=F0JDK5_9BACT|nr:cytochrome c3 family protein [Pseudodesulfovibrio mercurii]EGB13374.1 Cytochrome c, class III, conserved region [Pseudodesulfovibrio mercurii]